MASLPFCTVMRAVSLMYTLVHYFMYFNSRFLPGDINVTSPFRASFGVYDGVDRVSKGLKTQRERR
jgi:hypothetical protein